MLPKRPAWLQLQSFSKPGACLPCGLGETWAEERPWPDQAQQSNTAAVSDFTAMVHVGIQYKLWTWLVRIYVLLTAVDIPVMAIDSKHADQL